MNFSKFILKRDKINNIIRNQAKKDKSIVYGSNAMNKQIHPFTRRKSQDYDIYTKTPKRDARSMEKRLDKTLGGNYFYTKPAIHGGTWKVMNKGLIKDNPRDDINVVDYSFGSTPSKRISGVRYEKLSNIIKTKKKILKDKESKYRHEKDRDDLRRIRFSKALKKRKVGM